MGSVWKVIDGNKLLLNEISRITVLLPTARARANAPVGPGEADILLHFSLAVDTFVKGITILSKEKALESVGKMVRSEPRPIERLASFAAWLLELKVSSKATSPEGEYIASTIAAFRKEMYPVGSVVNAAMQLYLSAADRCTTIREGAGDDGVEQTLIYALHDVLGVPNPRGLTTNEIRSETPKYDRSNEAYRPSHVTRLLANQSDTLLADR